MKRYMIELAGHIDLSWGDWFEVAGLDHQPGGSTRLMVELPDQPALVGLLVRLHGLGFEFLCMKRIPGEGFLSKTSSGG